MIHSLLSQSEPIFDIELRNRFLRLADLYVVYISFLDILMDSLVSFACSIRLIEFTSETKCTANRIIMSGIPRHDTRDVVGLQPLTFRRPMKQGPREGVDIGTINYVISFNHFVCSLLRASTHPETGCRYQEIVHVPKEHKYELVIN